MFCYSSEHKEWMLSNFKNYNSWIDFSNDFNKYFNLDKSEKALRQYSVNHKLNIKINNNYSKDEIDFIKSHYKEKGAKETYRLYKEKYGDNGKSFRKLEHYCLDNFGHTNAKNSGCFIKGKRKYNYRVKNVNDISVRICKDGRIRVYIKLNDCITGRGKKDTRWMQLDKYIWEKYYGKIPKKYRLVHLDKDPYNCDISNLACVSRGTLIAISRHHDWYNGDKNITLAGIKIYELIEFVKNMKEKNND